MRKSLLKSLVATAVVGATMAITSVAAMADTSTFIYTRKPATNTDGYFTITGGADGNLAANQTVDNIEITKGFKMQGDSVITFDPKGTADVTIYWSGNGTDAATINVNGEDNENAVKKGVYANATYTGLTEPVTIKRGQTNTKQSVVYYIKVVDTYTSVDATDISLSETADIDILVDETYDVTASLTPENATSQITWKSDKEEVATVSNGTITGVAEGTATITATANGHSASVKVNVAPQKTVDDLTTITAGTYSLGSADIAKGSLFLDGKAFAADKLVYYTGNRTHNVGDEETFVGGYFLKNNGNGEIAVKLADKATITTVIYSSSSTALNALISSSYKGSGDLAKESANSYNELTYTNDTGADKVVYISADNNAYIAQIVVSEAATLTEGTFEAAGGKVVVKGTNAYLVGEFTKLDANGQLSVGNNNVFTTDTVYKSVVDGNDIIAAEKDGTYYYAVKVTDLTSDEEVAPLKRFTVA